MKSGAKQKNPRTCVLLIKRHVRGFLLTPLFTVLFCDNQMIISRD